MWEPRTKTRQILRSVMPAQRPASPVQCPRKRSIHQGFALITLSDLLISHVYISLSFKLKVL